MRLTLRQRLRRLHRQAASAYKTGQHFDRYHGIAAPAQGPLRIAFDAGRDSAVREQYVCMPLDVWQQVLADYLRGDIA